MAWKYIQYIYVLIISFQTWQLWVFKIWKGFQEGSQIFRGGKGEKGSFSFWTLDSYEKVQCLVERWNPNNWLSESGTTLVLDIIVSGRVQGCGFFIWKASFCFGTDQFGLRLIRFSGLHITVWYSFHVANNIHSNPSKKPPLMSRKVVSSLRRDGDVDIFWPPKKIRRWS